MVQTNNRDYYDELCKLEPKVVLAVSRLQRESKGSHRYGKYTGVESKQIVDYLSDHYWYLDGDIESQVITALLSCVKSGIICVLDNGKFRLVNPGSKTMISNCLTRLSHGSKCSCLDTINSMSKTVPNTCCFLKLNTGRSNTVKRLKKTAGRKSVPKQRAGPMTRQRSKKGKDGKGKTTPRCVQKMKKILVSKKTKENHPEDTEEEKCDYCLEVHPPPGQKKGKKSCKECHPPGTRYGVPYNKFSPREEVM